MPIRAPLLNQLRLDQLRDKALLALEDAVVECRYRTPRRSFAIRFALAYLWTYSGGSRKHYDDLWRALGAKKSPWSHSSASHSLGWIYRDLGIERDESIESKLWRRWTKEEGNGGGHGPG